MVGMVFFGCVSVCVCWILMKLFLLPQRLTSPGFLDSCLEASSKVRCSSYAGISVSFRAGHAFSDRDIIRRLEAREIVS